jgi:hypothetical protein
VDDRAGGGARRTVVAEQQLQLREYLRALRIQLWWREALTLLAISVGVAAASVAAAAVLDLQATTIQAGLLVVLGACLLAFVRRPSIERAARVADHHARLENRLATAQAILDGRLEGKLAVLQLADTWRACRPYHPRRIFRPLNRSVLVAIGGAIIASIAASLVVGNAVHLRSALEALIEPAPPIAGSAAATPPHAAQAQLESVSGSNPTILQADDAAALTTARLREQLQQQNAQSRAFEEAAAKLAASLQATAGAQDVAASLERGNYDKAAAQLADLGRESDQLSAGAKQQLARALLQASRDSSNLDATLSVAEQDAARALARADYVSGRKGLERLADVIASRQRALTSSADIARALQQLQQPDTSRAGNGASCGGGDEYGGPVDCSAGPVYSTGAMRSVEQSRGAPSPVAGSGDVARGGGYAVGGGSTSPLGDAVIRLDARGDVVVQVDLSPASAQGRGSQPDPKATTTVISQIEQKDVVLNGAPQSSEPITDPTESTVVSPARTGTVREFFQGARSPR